IGCCCTNRFVSTHVGGLAGAGDDIGNLQSRRKGGLLARAPAAGAGGGSFPSTVRPNSGPPRLLLKQRRGPAVAAVRAGSVMAGAARVVQPEHPSSGAAPDNTSGTAAPDSARARRMSGGALLRRPPPARLGPGCGRVATAPPQARSP